MVAWWKQEQMHIFVGFLCIIGAVLALTVGFGMAGVLSGPTTFLIAAAAILTSFGGYMLDNYLWWKFVRGGGGAWL